MIGKPEWFCARKFGWGMGIRKKEGLAYILVAGAIGFGIMMLPLPFEARMVGVGLLYAVFIADILHIMVKVYSKLDEREQMHHAMAERNASFVAVALLVAYLAYVSATSAVDGTMIGERALLPVGLLVAMSIAKGASLLYLERKG